MLTRLDQLIHQSRDPRVDNWFLMSSIWPTLYISAFYVYFVKVLGPGLMKEREAMSLRKAMIVYNAIQTLFSAWMFKESCFFFLTGRYNWLCEPVDYSDGPESRRALYLGYIYYLSKFLDMTDTVFMVARKKNSHVSLLHVVHHSTLPILCWTGPKFVGGGNTGFGPFLNTFVHTVMYGYYLLSAMGPSVQKFLWWKKYITTIQMCQFVMVFLHALRALFSSCDYPKAASLMFTVTGVQYFGLFLNFYRKAYSDKKPAAPPTPPKKDKFQEIVEEYLAESDEESKDKLNNNGYIKKMNGHVADKKSE